MKELSIRSYAYIGDAVYEVFARKRAICVTQNPKKLHKATSSIVNAQFHAEALDYIKSFLTEEEYELVRRARNLSVTTARRTNQSIHRLSTAFEALIGYLYLSNEDRLKDLYVYVEPLINEKLAEFD